MKINWKEFDEKIKNYKYPLVLIKKFFSSLNIIDDNNASIMLRFLIKNHFDSFYNNPFYLLCDNISKMKYIETATVLDNFYEIINTKIALLFNIKQWFFLFKNKKFWNKNLEEQIKELIEIKNLIKANFDNSKNGTSFGLKIVYILKNGTDFAKEQTLETLCIRLKNILKIMGIDFFKKMKIPIFYYEEFINLDIEDILKYSNYVFEKIIEILEKMISYFEEYNIIETKLKNLLNPCFINIEEDTIMEDEIEDLSLLF